MPCLMIREIAALWLVKSLLLLLLILQIECDFHKRNVINIYSRLARSCPWPMHHPPRLSPVFLLCFSNINSAEVYRGVLWSRFLTFFPVWKKKKKKKLKHGCCGHTVRLYGMEAVLHFNCFHKLYPHDHLLALTFLLSLYLPFWDQIITLRWKLGDVTCPTEHLFLMMMIFTAW